MSLREKTIKGLYWTTSAQVVERLGQVAFTAVLARLLAPRDFGLIGMALVFTRFANMVKGLGLGGAIIQRHENTQEELSSIYWLNISISLLLAFFVVGAAPLAEKFYHETLVRDILLVLASNIFLTSLSSVHSSLLNRELVFKKLAVIEMVTFILSNLLAIFMAVAGWGVWSLVGKLLSQTIISNILTLWVSSWTPSLRCRLSAIIPHLHFGGYMTLGNFFFFFTQNIDFILVGKYFGAKELGFYTVAFTLSALPGEQVKNILTRVLFPSFSRLKHDPQAFLLAFHKAVNYLSLIIIPLLFGLGAVAKELVPVLYGDQWQKTALLIPYLCMLGIARGLIHLANSAILAHGDSKTILLMEILQSMMMVFFISMAVFYLNILFVAFFYAVVQTTCFVITYYFLQKHINTNFFYFWKAIRSAFLAGLVMVAVIALVRLVSWQFCHGHEINQLVKLFMLVSIGAGVYLTVLLKLEGKEKWLEFKRLVRP